MLLTAVAKLPPALLPPVANLLLVDTGGAPCSMTIFEKCNLIIGAQGIMIQMIHGNKFKVQNLVTLPLKAYHPPHALSA
jgi:hypothetical protein